MRFNILKTLFLILLCTSLTNIKAQNLPVGRLDDWKFMKSYSVYANGLLVQIGNPMNAFFASKDPSGINFVMLPAITPQNFAYFINWNNQLMEVSRFTGLSQIGVCNCPPPINPYGTIYSTPHYDNKIGVETGTGFQPLPLEIVDTTKPYGNIMITSEAKALQCYQSSLAPNGSLIKDKFTMCMVEQMAGKKELAIFNCIRTSKTPEEQTLCLMQTIGGAKEKEIAKKLRECYNLYGSDYRKYPLCMAGTITDGSLEKVLACMEQQSRTGNITFLGTAVCYGTGNLNLNPETQIIVQCAVTSGGQPYVFAGCAGGQLMSRELDKCFTNGVGGANGCFGQNNTIIQGLRQIGNALQLEFGPNNSIVNAWNQSVHDLTVGPGPNNTAIVTMKNIGNEVGRASNNVGRELKNAVPKITIGW